MDITKGLKLDAVTRFNGEQNGEKFWFDAKEDMISPEFLEQIDSWETDKKATGLSDALAGVIVAWDLELEGKPFPPTAANLKKCPLKFLNYCLSLIVESWQGNPQTPSESVST